jgi:chaperonin GroES
MSKVSIKPIAGTKNRVLVLPDPAETVTAGGIIIPDSAQEKPQRGIVVSISDKDDEGQTPSVKVGDKILYGKYAGTELSHEGKDYLIMRESDIFAVI